MDDPSAHPHSDIGFLLRWATNDDVVVGEGERLKFMSILGQTLKRDEREKLQLTANVWIGLLLRCASIWDGVVGDVL